MLCDLLRRLFKRVPNSTCGSGHSVYAFQLQWESAQLVGEFCYRPASYACLRCRRAARAMQPPLEVCGGFELCVRVLFVSKTVGIENANHCKSFGKVSQAFVKLTIQEIGRPIPLAFEDH